MTTIEFWNLVVSSASALLSAIAILLYIILWFRDKSDNKYDVFDSIYMDILKTGIEHPEFRNIEYTSNYMKLSGNEKTRYEVYAFICWNFCETLVDKGDEELMKTWSVVIQTENSLHRTWFNQPENAAKFKAEFRNYIQKNF